MEPFVRLEGIAAPLPIDNVDTDAIIPSRETQSTARTGYGEKLFANWRYAPGTREKNPDFVLNRAPFDRARILVAGRNFGCGSSREAAVYVLADAGYRCVLAPSFGDIFSSNAVKNGVLPARVSAADIETLLADPVVLAGGAIRVDLAAQTVSVGNKVIAFEVRADWKKQLLNGWDDVDLTRSYAGDIAAFVARDKAGRPWATPGVG